jgi:hypothetical protein
MPHRTVFQLGKDHAHPFTNFVGGIVVGALLTSGIAWYYILDNYTDDAVSQTVTPPRPAGSVQETASPSPSVEPSAAASPAVTF